MGEQNMGEQEKPPLTIKNADKYLAFYEAVANQLSTRTPIEMKRLAYESTITAWMDNHPVRNSETFCAHCGGTSGMLAPFGVTRKHTGTWLHTECWRPWFVEQRRRAVEALREMGITALGADLG